MGTIRASASQVSQTVGGGDVLWEPHSPGKMGKLHGHGCDILMTWLPASHNPLSDDSGEKLPLGVSLETIVGFYLINSVNPVIDLISHM